MIVSFLYGRSSQVEASVVLNAEQLTYVCDWMETVHCSRRMAPGSGTEENSTAGGFRSPDLVQSGPRRTSMLMGTLFCQSNRRCFRKLSSRLH